MVVAATQRPSRTSSPPRCETRSRGGSPGRCTSDISSDIVLGHGWAARDWSANTIPTSNQGAGLLIAEGGTPQLVKAAYLSDADIIRIADRAAWTQGQGG